MGVKQMYTMAFEPDGNPVKCKVLKILFETNEINIEFPDGNCEFYPLNDFDILPQQATGSVKRVDEIIKIDISTIINQTGNNITYACGEIGSKQIRASFDLEKTIDIMEIGIRGLIPSELSPHKLKESCSEIINKIASDCIILREVKS